MVTSAADAPILSERTQVSQSLFRQRLSVLKRNRFGLTMIGISLLIIVVAILAPVVAPYDPIRIDPDRSLISPSLRHWLGTDELGRDLLSRVIFGARISIRIAAIVIALSVSIGVVVGTLAGYAGGRLDEMIMRVTDIFLAFPALVLAMALSAALGPSVENAAIALGIVWWPGYARLVRGQVLSVKHEPFVDASFSLGASPLRIAVKHVIPNSLDPVLVRMTLTGGNAILMSAALSFIGLGAQPPQPEWGLMVALARDHMLDAWWYPTIVGMVIFITVLVFTLAGDALQDAFYPD